MATDLDRSTSLQQLADSTGLIYDRSVTPEKVLGQAWLISRGRVVTLASAVSNYTDAPWALVIKFPHPNLHYAVRTVSLHPDFNKREARDYYLAQSRGPIPPVSFENDIATLALDSDVSVPEPEKIAELNRALSIPMEITAQDMSGAMRGADIISLLNSALSTGRSGLMTFVDARNVPFARVSIRQMRIVRAQFENLYNEIAMCELIQRKPSGNYALQSVDNFRWPADVPEIMTPSDQIFAEAVRREQELPRVVEMLGGPEARFQKSTKFADFNSINQADRWVAERIWEVLDGYLPLHKVPERAGTDTYSTVKMIWDFATMGLVGQNASHVFHMNGQLGPLLVPAQELDISTWEPLTAVYLDPMSAGPTAVTGNFFGPAHTITNKSLLHTIPIPPGVASAAVFKDGKLVGIHCGPAVFKPGFVPPLPLNKMMWVGSLNDLGTKRLRSTEAAADVDYDENDPQETSQKVSTLRGRTNEVGKSGVVTASGGNQAGMEEETGPLAKFSKQQLAGIGGLGFVAGLLMLIGSFLIPHGGGGNAPAPAPAAAPTAQTTDKPEDQPKVAVAPVVVDPDAGDPKAQELAQKLAAFGAKPPFSFKWKDTMKLTEPRESFGAVSDSKNTDILFINWPNIAPTTPTGLWQLSRTLPAYNYPRLSDKADFTSDKDSGNNWLSAVYQGPEGAKPSCIIGTAPAADPTHCIVWIAKGVTPNTNVPDLSFPSSVVQQMAAAGRAAAAAATTGGASSPAALPGDVIATPAQVEAYRKKVNEALKAAYKAPKADEDADTKVGMSFSIDPEGNVADLALKPNPDEAFNAAIQKAVEQSSPFPIPPKTKGKLQMLVRAEGSNLTVELN